MTGQRCAVAYWKDGQMHLIGPIGPTLVDQKIQSVLKVSGVTEASAVWLDPWWETEKRLGIPPSTAAAKAARYRRQVNRTGRQLVDSTGTRRRLQALACLGWSLPQLEKRAGVPAWYFQRLCQRTGTIGRDRAAIVQQMYDELWNTPAPETCQFEVRSASRAKSTARRNRFSPPASWDDDSIDDPAAVPSGRRPSDVAGDIFGRLKVA